MNFIGSTQGSEVRFELKYCERCGGLFLRRPAETRVYCAGCTVRLAQQMNAEEPPSKASLRKSRVRRRKREAGADVGEVQNASHIKSLQGVAEMGVWA